MALRFAVTGCWGFKGLPSDFSDGNPSAIAAETLPRNKYSRRIGHVVAKKQILTCPLRKRRMKQGGSTHNLLMLKGVRKMSLSEELKKAFEPAEEKIEITIDSIAVRAVKETSLSGQMTR